MTETLNEIIIALQANWLIVALILTALLAVVAAYLRGRRDGHGQMARGMMGISNRQYRRLKRENR